MDFVSLSKNLFVNVFVVLVDLWREVEAVIILNFDGLNVVDEEGND